MKDSKEQLLVLINDANLPKKPLTHINVQMDVPAIEEAEGYNTRLSLLSVPGRGYVGTADVFYKRIALNDVVVKTVRSPDPLTVASVLDLVNVASNVWLTEADIVPFEPPVLTEGQSAQLVLDAAPTSLGFTGSMTVSIEYGRSWLDQVVYSTTLEVLDHPIPITYRQSARMLTWSKDFTCLRDAIKPNKDGTYSDWDRLQTACAYMGIPTWYQGKITDRPTSEVPDSNPAFDRVVIQPLVDSTYMLGDMYFHYNILEEV